VRATVVLPTPPLSAPIRITVGVAITFSSQSVTFEVIHAETIGQDAIGG
jgi:hypothetical protein